MTSYPMQWLVQKLAERFVALFGRLFASRIETMVLMQEVADREQIELQAKQYEADGLVHLAEILRQRAKTLSADTPASLALPAIQHLAQDDFATLPIPSGAFRLTAGVTSDENSADSEASTPTRRLARKGAK